MHTSLLKIKGGIGMFDKDKVRQRRQERIKAIQNDPNKSRVPKDLEDSIEARFHRNELKSSSLKVQHNDAADKRLEDPEYVWKMKNNPWRENDDQENVKAWNPVPTANKIRNQIGLCILVFFMIWGMFQFDSPWTLKGRGFIERSLTEEFQFGAVASWYEEYFQGAPSFIPTFDKNTNTVKVNAKINKKFILPVTGVPKTSFTTASKGILLETYADAGIVSIEEGRVIYVGEQEKTGLTIVVQHTDQLQSVYGWVGQTSLQQNLWVKGGQRIGSVKQQAENGKGILYFAIKQGDQYINPVDVITFD
jgi:stage IV sporulation protein FA